MRRLLRFLLWVVPAAALLLLALSGNIMSQVEQPKYRVLETDGPIEIREYAPVIVAEVDVQGERMHALNHGFSLIANYIFGHNLSAQKVPMTAPVTQQPGEKIPMTAPVTQTGTGESWKVQFVMPSAYTLATLPQPQNPAVHLRALPARKTAAIRFSGPNTENNIATHRATLLHYLTAHHLQPAAPPTTAFYNPPWTLPFLRRNEILVDLQ